MFEKMWQMQEVPKGWKRANIAPWFIKRKNKDLENARKFSVDSWKQHGVNRK